MIVGYARTSTTAQKAGLDAQEPQLLAAGAERIFKEHASSLGARPQLKACLDSLGSGDVLVVTKPDRLARSTTNLLEIEASLRAKGVGLILLSMGGERIDTRNPTAKLILTVMGSIAAFERDLMLERQKEGIAKAKLDGKYKGRKPNIDAEDIKLRLADGGRPTDIARLMGISRNSVYRLTGEKR